MISLLAKLVKANFGGPEEIKNHNQNSDKAESFQCSLYRDPCGLCGPQERYVTIFGPHEYKILHRHSVYCMFSPTSSVSESIFLFLFSIAGFNTRWHSQSLTRKAVTKTWLLNK